MNLPKRAPHPATTGLVMHGAVPYYDLLAAAMTLGRERAFRERLVMLASIQAGETVLDVGCGTGTLAIAAKRAAGPTGTVVAVDAAPAMIARAAQKANRAGLTVNFHVGVAERLPVGDGEADVVLATLMLHHLPRPARTKGLQEMHRVLRPGGRLLIVDFQPSKSRGLHGRLHRHGHVAIDDLLPLLEATGFDVTARGHTGVSDLYYVLATVPGASDVRTTAEATGERSLGPLPLPAWVWISLAALVVGVHLVIVSGARALGRLTLAGTLVVVGLIVVQHLGLGVLLADRLRRRHRGRPTG